MFGLKKLEKKIMTRLKALILLMLTSGMGLGGYVGRDHPIMQKLLAYAGAKISDKPLSPEEEQIEKRVLGVISDRLDPFRKPGEFEVAFEKISLDDKEFRAGREVDIEVRVVKYGAQGGKGVVVFDGKDAGRPKVAGKGPIVVTWPEKAFKVEWKPGDEFDVEIWDRKGFLPTKKFVLETEEDGSFPLRTRTHTLTSDAEGKDVKDPAANTIAFKARRLSTADLSDTKSVADKSTERGSTRR